MAETKKTAEQLYAQAQEAQKQLEQLQAQQPGAYESSYGAQIDALMAQLDSRPGFTYDVNGDPLYRQYAEQYQRQGKAAMEDTLGAAAGLTGGYGSSYATTAASQAYQQYLSGMQDVAPALYAAAYARYQDEGTALEKQLERLQGLESNAYGAWQAQVQANQAAQAPPAQRVCRVYGDGGAQHGRAHDAHHVERDVHPPSGGERLFAAHAQDGPGRQ